MEIHNHDGLKSKAIEFLKKLASHRIDRSKMDRSQTEKSSSKVEEVKTKGYEKTQEMVSKTRASIGRKISSFGEAAKFTASRGRDDDDSPRVRSYVSRDMKLQALRTHQHSKARSTEGAEKQVKGYGREVKGHAYGRVRADAKFLNAASAYQKASPTRESHQSHRTERSRGEVKAHVKKKLTQFLSSLFKDLRGLYSKLGKTADDKRTDGVRGQANHERLKARAKEYQNEVGSVAKDIAKLEESHDNSDLAIKVQKGLKGILDKIDSSKGRGEYGPVEKHVETQVSSLVKKLNLNISLDSEAVETEAKEVPVESEVDPIVDFPATTEVKGTPKPAKVENDVNLTDLTDQIRTRAKVRDQFKLDVLSQVRVANLKAQDSVNSVKHHFEIMEKIAFTDEVDTDVKSTLLKHEAKFMESMGEKPERISQRIKHYSAASVNTYKGIEADSLSKAETYLENNEASSETENPSKESLFGEDGIVG